MWKTSINDQRFKISGVRCSLIEGGLPPGPKRQGWERLCGAVGEHAFPPGGGNRRKPHARAGAGKRKRSPRKKQRAGKPHLSGQPGGRGWALQQSFVFSFSDILRLLQRREETGFRKGAPPAEAEAVAPPRCALRTGRMAGRNRLKINETPRPRGEAAGAGPTINPLPRPAIRCGHPPAGGAPNAGARAP